MRLNESPSNDANSHLTKTLIEGVARALFLDNEDNTSLPPFEATRDQRSPTTRTC